MAEKFDVDGDRHVQIEELAAALEEMGTCVPPALCPRIDASCALLAKHLRPTTGLRLGSNDGGQVTEGIREMFDEVRLAPLEHPASPSPEPQPQTLGRCQR